MNYSVPRAGEAKPRHLFQHLIHGSFLPLPRSRPSPFRQISKMMAAPKERRGSAMPIKLNGLSIGEASTAIDPCSISLSGLLDPTTPEVNAIIMQPHQGPNKTTDAADVTREGTTENPPTVDKNTEGSFNSNTKLRKVEIVSILFCCHCTAREWDGHVHCPDKGVVAHQSTASDD